MEKFSEKAYAKINLTLDILRKRDDGYHEVKMIMQSIGLYDDVSVQRTGNGEIVLNTNVSYIPTDKKNIAVAAAEAFFKYTGIQNDGINIEITKRIPVAAGLAGGSADGAAVLRALNKAYNTGLSYQQLCEIATKVGSDVAFCIKGGTAIATGRGEIVNNIAASPNAYVVVCSPSFSVSTPKVYALVDVKRIKNRPDTDGMLDAIKNNDLLGIARRVYNVFEPIVAQKHQCINEIRTEIINGGAVGAAMSGSGPTVYGIFDNKEAAVHTKERLSAIYKNVFAAAFQGEYV